MRKALVAGVGLAIANFVVHNEWLVDGAVNLVGGLEEKGMLSQNTDVECRYFENLTLNSFGL